MIKYNLIINYGNKKLMNNSLSLKIIKIFILILSLMTSSLHAKEGFTRDTGFDPDNLSDGDKTLSETYEHQGYTDRAKEELCDKAQHGDTTEWYNTTNETESVNPCEQSADKIDVLWGITPQTAEIMMKAVAMVFQMGSSYKVKTTTPPVEAGGKPTEKEEKKDDYCRYIAMATEAVAMAKQQIDQATNKLDDTDDTSQVEALYRTRESHTSRASNSKIQAAGWGLTAGCYTVQLAMNAASMVKAIDIIIMSAKIGLSTFATIFYIRSIARHEAYADAINDIIKEMPKKGECNPITENHCFCAEPETMNDPEHCAANIRQRQIAQGKRVACVDSRGQGDPNCNCLTSNSCYDKTYMNMLGGGVTFGNSAEKVAGKNVAELSRGNVGALIASGETGAQNALKKVLRKSKSLIGKLPRSKSLNSRNKSIAREIAATGIHPRLAALAASVKTPPGAKKFASKFRDQIGSGKFDPSKYKKKRNRTIRLSGGRGLRGNLSSNKRRKKKGNKAQKITSKKGNILSYAEKAQQSAQISQRPEKNIFQIISRRYQISGWKNVEIKE